jgi:hypothetical protein
MSLHQPLVVSTTAIAQPQRAQATGALRRHKQPLRTLGAALAGALLVATMSYSALQAAEIPVTSDEPVIDANGKCSLIEAIVNANADAALHADCPAGDEADTIILEAEEYTLEEVDNADEQGANGLPIITSEIEIEGNGAHITRDEEAPPFRILAVAETGELTLDALTISGGYLDPSLGTDIFGAGIFNDGGALTLNHSTISNNEGIDGGGALFNSGEATLTHSTLSDNTTEGDGAGIFNEGGEVTVENSTISGNDSTDGEGGGIFNEAESFVTLINSTVSGNHAGFGGAGISNDGSLTLTNSTITANHTEGTGGGIRTRVAASMTIAQSIIAGNVAAEGNEVFNRVGTEPGVGVITVDAHNLFGDSSQSNLAAFANDLFQPGASDLTATSDGSHPTTLDAMLDPNLQNNGGATETHALVPGSPALNGAPTGPETDQRGLARPQGNGFDIGAFEWLTPPTVRTLFVSAAKQGEVAGIAFRDEDILAYYSQQGQWAMFFDGSDVGLRAGNVDAFALLPNGDILLSVDQPLRAPGLGVIDDSDILQFTPTSLGPNTAGTFAFYLDGSDVGLTQDGEDIDAIEYTADGDLLVSTKGKATVEGLVALDEDVMHFTPTALGADTVGEWSLAMDGSDLALTDGSEDVNALAESNGLHFLMTKGDFHADDGVNTLSGDEDDLFGLGLFQRGDDTAGQLFAYLNADTLGFEPTIDGVALDMDGVLAAHLSLAQGAAVTEAGVADFTLAPDEAGVESAIDQEMDDYDTESGEADAEQAQRQFLPLITR